MDSETRARYNRDMKQKKEKSEGFVASTSPLPEPRVRGTEIRHLQVGQCLERVCQSMHMADKERFRIFAQARRQGASITTRTERRDDGKVVLRIWRLS